MSVDRRRLALLAVLVAVLGHEAALAIGYGPGAQLSAALRSTEHGLGWVLTVLSTVLAGGAALGVAAWRLRGLRVRLARMGVALPARGGGRLSDVLAVAHRIFAAAILLFLLQENAEHALLHGHLPGLDALLAGQYVATIPTFVLLSLAVATVAVLLAGRTSELVRALSAAVRTLPRPPATVARPRPRMADVRARTWRMLGPSGRRAPPALVA
jgi:hypothetical protein